MGLLYQLAKDLTENHEAYHLWYEYLKENKDYKKVCDIMLELFKLPENERQSFFLCQVEKFEFIRFRNLSLAFFAWGDIYNTSWEDKLLDINQRIAQGKENERIIQLPDLLTALQYPNLFTIGIPLNANIDDLVKQFREIVSRKQEELKVKPVEKTPPFPLPSRKLSEDDIKNLWRYLEVYRLREKGTTWKEVIEKIDPGNGIHNSIHIKVWQREGENAADIIENTGKNIFPGEYGQVKERKNMTTKKQKR